MTNEQFQVHLEHRLVKISETLSKKAGEYAQDGDRLHNFKVAARLGNTTVPKAILGMWMKHIVSIFDMIENPLTPEADLVDEKIGDSICYHILLSAAWQEQRDNLEQFRELVG